MNNPNNINSPVDEALRVALVFAEVKPESDLEHFASSPPLIEGEVVESRDEDAMLERFNKSQKLAPELIDRATRIDSVGEIGDSTIDAVEYTLRIGEILSERRRRAQQLERSDFDKAS